MATSVSGTASVDAIIGLDARVNSLVYGTKWESSSLTYSFVNAASSFSTSTNNGYGPSSDLSREPWNGRLNYFSATSQDAAVSAIGKWASVANLSFQLESESQFTNGDIRFAFTDVGASQAVAYTPGVAAGGDVWFSYTQQSRSFAEGSYNYMTMIHELGHALGLKHPFEQETGNPFTLPIQLDSQSYTLMSYSAKAGVSTSDFSFRPTSPMVLDIQAIQYLYGANTSHNADNTVYSFEGGKDYHQTIWDGGGIDTLAYAGMDGTVIDLQAGSGSLLGNPIYYVDSNASREPIPGNVWIAAGVNIERAAGGSGADLILGAAGANQLDGSGGNDTLSGGGGNDLIEGGPGADVVVFSGVRSDYVTTFHATTGRYTLADRITGRDGTDVVSTTERFQFSDGTVANTALSLTPLAQGSVRSVIGLSEAFFGVAPAAPQFSQALTMVSKAGVSALATALANGVVGLGSAELTGVLCANLGIQVETLGGPVPEQSYSALTGALIQIFDAFAQSRGQVGLNIVNLLEGLESDGVYGQVAASFNNRLAGDAAVLGPVGLAVEPIGP